MRTYVNPQTLKSLRALLQHLEQIPGPNLTPEDFAELRRILLNRIAELEATPAREAPVLDREPAASEDNATVPVAVAPPVDATANPDESGPELKLAS